MSGGRGRGGGSDRSVSFVSTRTHLMVLLLALLADATGAILLVLIANNFDVRSIKPSMSFSSQPFDLVAATLTRMLTVALVWFPLHMYLRGGEEDEDEENEDGYTRVSATDLENDFAAARERSIRRQGKLRVKYVSLFLVFLLFTATNVYVSVKCLFYKFTRSPLEPALMALTVLWVNIEVFALDVYMEQICQNSDAYKPDLHPHRLTFNHAVVTTRCDVCSQRIEKECLQCHSCDFDVCLPCFRRRTLATAENVLTRGDRGVADQAELSPLHYVARSFAFLAPYWRVLALALSCLVVNEIIRVTIPNFQGKVMDSVIAGDMTSFWQFIRFYCLLSVCTMLLGSLRSFCSTIVMRDMTMGLRQSLFSKLIYRDISFYDGATVGSLTARMTNDVQAMTQPINTLMSSVLSNVITLCGGTFMCLAVSWRLAMISLSVVGPILYITSTYARWSSKLNRGIWDALAQANGAATEAFSNIRTVRSFSTEEYEINRFSESMREALSKTMRDAIAFSGSYLMTNFMDLGTRVILLGFGGYMVITRPGELTMGQLITFQLYSNMMTGAYQGLNGILNDFTKSAGAAERVFSMLDGAPDIDPRVGVVLPAMQGTFAMENVNFYYQMRPDRQVLRDLSVTFPCNTVTAIVGRSGGGKSTLMHLLLRMYDPQAGRVLLDGRNLKEINLSWLHKQVAVVAQDTQLFNTSISANIAYGLDNVTQADVERAATAANAHEFILGFPEGYATQVGERGVRLSGGQRQRIAIARALLRKPRLLLLDEATSALDAESEALVQEALDKLIQNLQQSTTIIVIAHRLSTIINAHNIVVLGDGGVLEQGTHATLLANNGPYWRLVSRQIGSGSTTIDFDRDATPPPAEVAAEPEQPSRGRGRGGARGRSNGRDGM